MPVPGAGKDPLILTHFTLCQASYKGKGAKLGIDIQNISSIPIIYYQLFSIHCSIFSEVCPNCCLPLGSLFKFFFRFGCLNSSSLKQG